MENEEIIEKPPKERKKKKEINLLDNDALRVLDEHYHEELNTNPLYSLEIDPTNKYHMNEELKKFVTIYLNTHNLSKTCDLLDMEMSEGKTYYNMFCVQQEIRRLSMAMYHHRFNTKMASLDEIGGFLTSMIMDYCVPDYNKATPKDKIAAARLIVDINKIKNQAIQDPNTFDVIDVEAEIKDLSVNSIKALIKASEDKDKIKEIKNEKDEIINQLNINNSLSPEELTQLKSLSIKELSEILDSLK